MSTFQKTLCLCLSILLCPALSGCATQPQHLSLLQATPLVTNNLQGEIGSVRDPSVALQNGTYYLFSTDPAKPATQQYLPIRCSADQVNWRVCGYVFDAFPAWIRSALPGVRNLWAPDISFFDGLYHLYYSASALGSQSSVIGVATNTTLDPADASYRWVDHGQVIASHEGDDFNAIDPNILIDTDQRVWLTYGSFWTGIKQREIDPGTGKFLPGDLVEYQLAARPAIADGAEEGSSLVRHGAFYYLFLSVDHCCAAEAAGDDYKQIVGRSTSPHGPFVDARGAALLDGGGSILLQGNATWLAPGAGTVFLNPPSGDSFLVFQALQASKGAESVLWLKKLTWQNDWPVLD